MTTARASYRRLTADEILSTTREIMKKVITGYNHLVYTVAYTLLFDEIIILWKLDFGTA
jgi:hypothetical protein